MSARLLFISSVLLVTACRESAAPMPSLPDKPPVLLATAKPGEIVLEWPDIADEQRYMVEVSNNGGPWQLLLETAADVVTARHANVQAGVTYSYRVAACNAAGCSEFAVVSAKAGVPPDLLSFGARDIGAYNVTLTATARRDSLPVHFWFVIRKAGSAQPVLTTEPTAPWTPIDTASTLQVSRMVMNLEPLTDYEVSAYAGNSIGTTAAGAPQAFRTSGFGPPIFESLSKKPTENRYYATLNPNGLLTQCDFEVVPAGQSFDNPLQIRTVSAQPVSGLVTVEMKFHFQAAGTYWWRVVARNSSGTTISAVQTVVKQL